MIIDKRTYLTIGAVSAAIIGLASTVAAFEKLGWAEILPASRGHVHKIAQVLYQQQSQDAVFWVEQFQAKQRQLQFEREQFKQQYPDRPVPRVFDEQHQQLENRIKRLENLQMFKPPE